MPDPLSNLANSIPSVRSEIRLIGFLASLLVVALGIVKLAGLPPPALIALMSVLIGALVLLGIWAAWRMSHRPFWASEEAVLGMIEAGYQFEIDGRAIAPHVIEGSLSQPVALPPSEPDELETTKD